MARPFRTTAQHAVAVVEAGYSLDGTDGEWLGRVLDAARADIEHRSGSYAFVCRVGRDALAMEPAYVERQLDAHLSSRVGELNRAIPGAFFDLLARSAVLVGGFLEIAPPALRSHLESTMAPDRFDAFALFAQDGEGFAVNVSAPARVEVHAPPRVRGIWSRAGLHVASAMRLRRRFHAAAARRDALLTPGGALAHAEGALRDDRTSRAALAAAVRAVERARTARERSDPERALAMWRGLVAGEWSLVDQWESDGRRYVAAYRNRPELRDPRLLTRLERSVLAYASLGQSNKEIAFTLGLSTHAVASAVSHILRKLRCRRRSDVLAFADPARATHVRVAVEGEAIDVLAVPHAPAGPVFERLTAAERAVAEGVVAGMTNAAIAKARGTSAHTVANQVRCICEKLDVGTRAQIARAVTAR